MNKSLEIKTNKQKKKKKGKKEKEKFPASGQSHMARC